MLFHLPCLVSNGYGGENMEKKTVLLVDSNKEISELMHLYLVNRGYKAIQAFDANHAIEQFHSEQPQLILLDIDMPGTSGYEVCKTIRVKSDIPIIFVTNRNNISDKIMGFQVGGNDYITKPFDFEEMELRVKTIISNYKKNVKKKKGKLLIANHLEIHTDSYKFYLNGTLCPLTTKEFDILKLLIRHPNQIFSAEHIYDHVWGFSSTGLIDNVKVHIRNLRKKIEKDPTAPEILITSRGFGYYIKG